MQLAASVPAASALKSAADIAAGAAAIAEAAEASLIPTVIRAKPTAWELRDSLKYQEGQRKDARDGPVRVLEKAEVLANEDPGDNRDHRESMELAYGGSVGELIRLKKEPTNEMLAYYIASRKRGQKEDEREIKFMANVTDLNASTYLPRKMAWLIYKCEKKKELGKMRIRIKPDHELQSVILEPIPDSQYSLLVAKVAKGDKVETVPYVLWFNPKKYTFHYRKPSSSAWKSKILKLEGNDRAHIVIPHDKEDSGQIDCQMGEKKGFGMTTKKTYRFVFPTEKDIQFAASQQKEIL